MSLSDTSSDDVFEYTGRGQIVPKDVVEVHFHPDVCKVEDKAFYECSKLKKVVFNASLQDVGEGAFCGCINLVEVVFNDKLHTIGQRAFYGTALECIRLPKYLREIGNLAFYNCKSLRTIFGDYSPHNNVKKVGIHAFDNCPSLQKLRLPEIVNRLGEIIQYHPEVVTKVDAVLDKKVKRKKRRSRGLRFGDEFWNLRVVFPIVEINDPHGQQCETTGCQLAACCAWSGSNDPSMPWFCCLDCQEKDFKGWPAKKDIPLRRMSNELRNAMIQRSTKWSKYPAPWPNLPTGRGDMAVVPSEVSDSSVERRGNEIFISSSLVDMGRSKYWTLNKRWQLGQISKSIAYYEMKEGLTLFELALWKAKIEQAGGTSHANRNACRIEVPGPVKDCILQYLPF